MKREKRAFNEGDVEKILEVLEEQLTSLSPEGTCLLTIKVASEIASILSWTKETIVSQKLMSKKVRLKTSALIRAAKEHLSEEELRELDSRVERNLGLRREDAE